MEKKKYITPECEVVEMDNVYMSSTSPVNPQNPGTGGGTDVAGGDDMGANRHRGEWGNLWSDFGK